MEVYEILDLIGWRHSDVALLELFWQVKILISLSGLKVAGLKVILEQWIQTCRNSVIIELYS